MGNQKRFVRKLKLVLLIAILPMGIYFKLQYGMVRKSDKFILLRCFFKFCILILYFELRLVQPQGNSRV